MFAIYDCTTKEFTESDKPSLRTITGSLEYDKHHRVTTFGIDLTTCENNFAVCILQDDFIDYVSIKHGACDPKNSESFTVGKFNVVLTTLSEYYLQFTFTVMETSPMCLVKVHGPFIVYDAKNDTFIMDSRFLSSLD